MEAGVPRQEAAKTFGVSVPRIDRYLRMKRQTGRLEPKALPGRPSHKGKALESGLLLQLEAYPDATLEEHCAWWEGRQGVRVSTATMSRAIARLGWPLKKSR